LSDDIDAEADWRGDLMWAIEDEQPDDVAILAPGHELNFVDETSGFTPLMLAVDSSADGAHQRRRAPDVTVVELLLSHGASPTLKGRNGEDAADVARNYHWHEAIDAMHGADPDGVPKLFWPLDEQHDEDTPWRADLMDAIKRTDVGRVRALLADQEGTLDFVHLGSCLTPLQLAIEEQGDTDRHPTRDATIVRLLLAAGAAPDFPPDEWSTPLRKAEGWPEVTEQLRAAIDR
jgi:hypothetical protein